MREKNSMRLAMAMAGAAFVLFSPNITELRASETVVAQNITGKRVTLNLRAVKVKQFFDAIKKQTGLNFIYNSEEARSVAPITVQCTNEDVRSVIDRVMRNAGCSYTIEGNIVTVSMQADNGPLRRLTGVVRDGEGLNMPGVNVYIRGTKYHATTNGNGEYSFRIPSGACTVSYSFIGMKTKALNIGKGSADLKRNVVLVNDTQMEEVVVTGIFNKPKVSFTGAATTITKDEIQAAGNRNLLKSIANIDPSFDLQENNFNGSDPNAKLSIEIRGKSSLAADPQNLNNVQDNVNERNEYNMPLFILDGFEVTSERVMDMNQADVESIVILKDASATAIYGSRGANGVVVITSARPQLGKVRVSYSFGMNLEIPDLSSYNMMNSFEKLEAEKAAGVYTSTDLTQQVYLDNLYAENLRAAREGVNTDWMRKPLRTGIGQYHSLNLGGGTDQFRYNLHVAYNQLQGTMKGSGRNNMNAGL